MKTSLLPRVIRTIAVLGRLLAESIENAPQGPAFALRLRGVPEGRVLLYATLPQVLPQLVSYVLYRWESNIRAAAILGWSSPASCASGSRFPMPSTGRHVNHATVCGDDQAGRLRHAPRTRRTARSAGRNPAMNETRTEVI